MQLSLHDLPSFGERLMAERKRQGLSRTQAAAVCNVSASFIRDAESAPERCTLGRLLQLVQGLGLAMQVQGLQDGPAPGAEGATPLLALADPSLPPPPTPPDTPA